MIFATLKTEITCHLSWREQITECAESKQQQAIRLYSSVGRPKFKSACETQVTSVGLNTEWGRVMATVTQDNAEPTPLQERLSVAAVAIGKIGLAVSILVFTILTARLV